MGKGEGRKRGKRGEARGGKGERRRTIYRVYAEPAEEREPLVPQYACLPVPTKKMEISFPSGGKIGIGKDRGEERERGSGRERGVGKRKDG